MWAHRLIEQGESYRETIPSEQVESYIKPLRKSRQPSAITEPGRRIISQPSKQGKRNPLLIAMLQSEQIDIIKLMICRQS